MNNSDEWIDYLVAQTVPGYGQPLSRVEPLFNSLKIPKRLASTVITVTGTNGKGSVVKTLEAIYIAAGYRVAAVTSPHLRTIHERLTFDGEQLCEADVQYAFSKVASARDTRAPINYFDFIHLAWFLLIADYKPDIAIIEVGCGGRLDMTNLLDSDIAVITSIDLDHKELLGDTRELIAIEKAHLARPGCPVVCGESDLPHGLLSFLEERGARPYCLLENFWCEQKHSSWDWLSTAHTLTALPLPHVKLENAAVALQVIDLMQAQKPTGRDAIEQGLTAVRLPGRFERVQLGQCELVYDVAHNPHAARWLAEQLIAQPVPGKTYAVMGMLNRKDVYHTVEPFVSLVEAWYVASLQHPDTYLAEKITEQMQALGIKKCYTSNSLADQLDRVCQRVGLGDRMIVFGSFHAVHEAKCHLEKREPLSG